MHDCSKIWGVHPHELGDGSYIVEFKDPQDAARYEMAAQQARKALAGSPASDTKDEDASSNREVEISGLPPPLMSRAMLEATLEQAGLEKDLIRITFLKPGSGKVRIAVANQKAAKACAQHFHGCKWNPGASVSARVLSVKAECSQQLGQSKASSSISETRSNLRKYAPAYIHSSLADGPGPTNGNRRREGTSDASTTVSDEPDEDEESWEADLRKVMSGCTQ